MTADSHPAAKARQGSYVVRRPLSTDALGHALRGAFADTAMPDDMAMLLRRLDLVTH